MNHDKKIILFDIDYTLFKTDEFKESNLTQYNLYPEVEQVLTILQKNAVLGIFSEGDFHLQHEKLLQTNIKQFFVEEHLHIVVSKSESLVETLKNYHTSDVTLVDDKLTILHQAKNHLQSLKTIWVKRGMYAENQKPIAGFSPDYIIETLEELLEIFK